MPSLTPWQKTQVARHPQRPHCLDYVAALITDFTPLAGDRKFGEDEAIVGGFGRFRGESVCVIGQEKGSATESRIKHNFGMARPEGYRKAVRLMEMADRFAIPVLSLVDTAGRLSGHRRRGARAGRGDRALDRGLPRARRAQRRGHPRRRRLGRRDRDRHRQSRADAGARDLQRDLARGGGFDPVARHQQGAGRRDQHEDHRPGPGAIRGRSTGSSPSRSAAPTATPQAAIAATGEAIAQALISARAISIRMRSGSSGGRNSWRWDGRFDLAFTVRSPLSCSIRSRARFRRLAVATS